MSTNEGGGQGLFNSLTPDYAGRSDYAINSGHAINESGQGPTSYTSLGTYVWPSEVSTTLEQLTGVSFQRSTVNIRQITDGTTNTYLVGEKHIYHEDYLTGRDFGDNETWCTGFNNDNFRVTSRNNGTAEAVPIPDNSRVPADDGNNRLRFGSAHPGGVNMSLCDGNVTTISFDIDWQIHRDMGNREDGNASRLP